MTDPLNDTVSEMLIPWVQYMERPGAAPTFARLIAWQLKQRWKPRSGKMYVGTIPCSMCAGGAIRARLHFKTGRLFGRCTTDGCFNVAQEGKK